MLRTAQIVMGFIVKASTIKTIAMVIILVYLLRPYRVLLI